MFGEEISGRDLVLLVGGLFLLGKATHEIHSKLEGEEGEASARVALSFTSVIVQILLLDIVFSLDSVITAVGMVQQVAVMIAAVVVAVGFMLAFSGPISDFVSTATSRAERAARSTRRLRATCSSPQQMRAPCCGDARMGS